MDVEREAVANDDWVIPALLVGAVVVAAIVIGIIVGIRTAQADDTPAGQLEAWTECLRSEGANVPLVESLRDGGVRITLDGSLLDGGVDMGTWVGAVEACEDETPESLEGIVGGLLLVRDLPFLGDFYDDHG